jgi:hypothetical protein
MNQIFLNIILNQILKQNQDRSEYTALQDARCKKKLTYKSHSKNWAKDTIKGIRDLPEFWWLDFTLRYNLFLFI